MPTPARRSVPELFTDLLDRIRDGDRAARDRFLGWVYDEGLEYFTAASFREQLLSPEEAADLAGDCVLELNRVLLRVRNPEHYVRRMFRNNLRRFLRRKRARLLREAAERAEAATVVSPESTRPRRTATIHRFDDEQRRMWRTARRRIEEADAEMRQIIRYRTADEPLPYRVIGQILGANEPALRMRMTRFCRSVRRDYARNEKRRAWRAPDRMPTTRRRPSASGSG